jgi:hypothetical protein
MYSFFGEPDVHTNSQHSIAIRKLLSDPPSATARRSIPFRVSLPHYTTLCFSYLDPRLDFRNRFSLRVRAMFAICDFGRTALVLLLISILCCICHESYNIIHLYKPPHSSSYRTTIAAVTPRGSCDVHTSPEPDAQFV